MSLDAFLASPLVQLKFVGLAGIVVWHLSPRRRANTRLVVQIAFFVVPHEPQPRLTASPPVTMCLAGGAWRLRAERLVDVAAVPGAARA
jgi:hypothetical protein